MNEPNESRASLADVHSHILPGMDDGAQSVEESIAMLQMSYTQGVRHIWSTSHFYPEKESPNSFLARREKAAHILAEKWDGASMPAVYLGAEVAYFFGIGRCQAVTSLTVGQSPYILIEMPTGVWSPDTVEDLLLVKYFLGLKPIIAHVERCMPNQSRKVTRRLADEGIYFQSNAAFLGKTDVNKREIRTMMREELIDLIGSDCHGIEYRKPNLLPGIRLFSEVADARLLNDVLTRAMRMTSAAVPFLSL